MSKNRDELPVDLTKSRFSIDFLLHNTDGNERERPLEHHSPSASPDFDDDLEGDRDDNSSPCASRHDHNSNDERRKRPRTAFTGTQIKTLEAEFEKNKYLSVVKRIELSKSLGLSQQQLKVWYQNRRTKWKRKYANDLESMAQQYYNSMGLAGSRPMLIGDRLWIFNSPHDVANPLRRGAMLDSMPSMPVSSLVGPPIIPTMPSLVSQPPFPTFTSFTSLPRTSPFSSPTLTGGPSKST